MESDRELYDGVLPADYPDTYQGILNARCLKSNGVLYSCPGDKKAKLCVFCYYKRRFGQRNFFRRRHGWHSVTTFTGEDLYDITRCRDCHDVMVTVGSPAECRHCITAFMEFERVFNRFRYGYEWDNVSIILLHSYKP